MPVSVPSEHLADWKDFFIAALTGNSAYPDMSEEDVVKISVKTADLALFEYRQRAEGK